MSARDVRGGPGVAAGADVPPGWPDGFAARVDERLTRLGLTSGIRRDCALGVLVAVVSAVLLAVLLSDPRVLAGQRVEPSRVTTAIVVIAAQGLLLSIRRVRPVLCLFGVALLQVELLTVLPSGATVRGLSPFVAGFTCGALLSPWRAAAVVTVAAGLEVSGFAAQAVASDAGPVAVVGEFFTSLLVYAAAVVAGGYVATRRRYVELLRVRAAEQIESERTRADAAVRQERSRMARELHDIAAHHLSAMVVQAAVVERLVDHDPRTAKTTAAAVRRQGRQTLRDLRLVVGALREPGEDPVGDDGAPVPGVAALDDLVRRTVDLGTPVELDREGECAELPPVADVTLYRVAQEALANAREHAPGAPARVALRYRDAEVVLEVVNEPRTAPVRSDTAEAAEPAERSGPGMAAPGGGRRGFGLIGMRERAQLIGAGLNADATPEGGWRVALTVPLDREGRGVVPDSLGTPLGTLAQPGDPT